MDGSSSSGSAQEPILPAVARQEIDEAAEDYWHQRYLQEKAEAERLRAIQAETGRQIYIRGPEFAEVMAITNAKHIEARRLREQQLLQQPPSTSADEQMDTGPAPPSPFIDTETVQGREFGQEAAQEYGKQSEALAQKRKYIKKVADMHPAKRKKLVGQLDDATKKLTPLPDTIIKPEQADPWYIEHCMDLNVDPNNEEMMHVYRKHWASEIRTRHLHGVDKKTDYKCFLRVDNPRLTIRQLLTQICNAEPTAFRINVEYAAILQNLETNELKYFFNAENTRVFDSSMLVRGQADMDKLIQAVERHDLGLYAAKMRPNTKWVLRKVTTAVVSVHRMPMIIGRCFDKMKVPNFIRQNKGLKNFILNPDTHRRWRDPYCFWRCVSEHVCRIKDIDQTPEQRETCVRDICAQFCRKIGIEPEDYIGMQWDWLSEAENFIGYPIYIFELQPHVTVKEQRQFDRFCQQQEANDATDLAEQIIIEEEMKAQAAKKGRFCAQIIRRPDPKLVRSEDSEKQAMCLNRIVNETGSAHYSYIYDHQAYSKRYPY